MRGEGEHVGRIRDCAAIMGHPGGGSGVYGESSIYGARLSDQDDGGLARQHKEDAMHRLDECDIGLSRS